MPPAQPCCTHPPSLPPSLPPSEGPNGGFCCRKATFLSLVLSPLGQAGAEPQPVPRAAQTHSPTTRAAHSTGTAPTVRARHSIWPIAFTLYGKETISSSSGSALRCSFNLLIGNTSDMKGPWFGCSGKEQTAFGGYLQLKSSQLARATAPLLESRSLGRCSVMLCIHPAA